MLGAFCVVGAAVVLLLGVHLNHLSLYLQKDDLVEVPGKVISVDHGAPGGRGGISTKITYVYEVDRREYQNSRFSFGVIPSEDIYDYARELRKGDAVTVYHSAKSPKLSVLSKSTSFADRILVLILSVGAALLCFAIWATGKELRVDRG